MRLNKSKRINKRRNKRNSRKCIVYKYNSKGLCRDVRNINKNMNQVIKKK